MKKLVLGSDHAGFSLKEKIKASPEVTKFAVEDIGCFSEEKVDYPEVAKKAARKIEIGKAHFAILVCGSGIGMAMTANRFKKVRAVNAYDVTSARLARAHNNANVLTLGGRCLAFEKAAEIVNCFLNTPFDGGRHRKRIQMMDGR